MLPKIIGEGAESTEELLKESEIEFWQASKKFYEQHIQKLSMDSKSLPLAKNRLLFAKFKIKSL